MKSLLSSARVSSGGTPTAETTQAPEQSAAESNAALVAQMQPETTSSTPFLDMLSTPDAAQRNEKLAAKPKRRRTRRKKPKADEPLALSNNPRLTAEDANSYNYKAHQGAAFLQGEGDATDIDQEDVNQGYLGDCYLMASMAATAQAVPEAIRNAIKDNGDGTFDVTLQKNGKPITVKVDNNFPSTGGGNLAYADKGDEVGDKIELWPAIIEKAWAILNQSKEGTGYSEIEGGLPGDAVEAITGRQPTDYDPRHMGGKTILKTIQTALDNKNPVTCATLGDEAVSDELKKHFDKYGFHANHCYTFYSVDAEGGTLNLRNPWGTEHPAPIPIDVFKKCFDTLSVNKAA